MPPTSLCLKSHEVRQDIQLNLGFKHDVEGKLEVELLEAIVS